MAKARDRENFNLFTLNVGNTHTRLLGWHTGSTMATCLVWRTNEATPHNLHEILGRRGSVDAAVVLAGVVPDIKEGLALRLSKSGFSVQVFREHLKPAIIIAPKPAEKVGDDRIAGALGALFLDARRPWVIVDVGTAVTVNAATPARSRSAPRFEGGLIIPGLAISLKTMSEHTALLPDLDIAQIPSAPDFIGRNTKEAMLFGVYHAQIGAAAALARGQMRKLGARTRVALTGGGASDPNFVREFVRAFPKGSVVPFSDLIHLGLFATWLSRRGSSPKGTRL